jgi:hypothetical protein
MKFGMWSHFVSLLHLMKVLRNLERSGIEKQDLKKYIYLTDEKLKNDYL